MPREPENVGEVFLGSAGQALEQIGQMYPQHQAGKRQALLNAFSMQMKVEAADTEKALAGERMSHLAALTRLAELRGEEVTLKMANFLPEIEELEAKARIKREGLEHSMGVAREAVSAPGEPGEGVVIPSGVKIWERPPEGGRKVEKPPFTPYQQYQIGRTEKKEARQETIQQADRLWSSISGDLNEIIEGEDTEFIIKDITDIDHALKLLQSSKDVPYALHPKLHEVAVRLQQMRDSYYKEPTSDEQADFDRLMKKYGNQ